VSPARPPVPPCLALIAALLAFALSGAMTAAGSTLLGDAVTSTFIPPPGAGMEHTATIADPGVEFTYRVGSTPHYEFDFSDHTLTVRLGVAMVSARHSYWTFEDIDWFGEPAAVIAGAVVEPGSVLVAPGAVSFTDHSLTVDLCCGDWGVNDTATIRILSSQDPVPTAASTWGGIKAHYR
jgi:hypothetical protein